MKYTKYIKNGIVLIIIAWLPDLLSAQRVYIGNGANMIMSGTVNLVLSDMSFTNDGNFLSTGNFPLDSNQVLITGSRGGVLGGTSTSTFNNLTVQKGNNSAQLQQNIIVKGRLSINRGDLVLNNFNVDLASTGSLVNEQNNHSIFGNSGGSVSVTRTLSAPATAFNPGNIGVEITTADIPGVITVVRTHVPAVLSDGSVGIQRSFAISSAASGGAGALLKFFYLDTELNGNTEGGLILWGPTGSQDVLMPIGKDANDSLNNWVVKSNLARFGTFTLGHTPETGGPAPIQSNSHHASTLPGSLSVIRTAALVYPNPSAGQFNLELTSSRETQVLMNLVDQGGRVLKAKEIHCFEGTNTVPWNLSRYASGVYFIVFKGLEVANIEIIKK